MWVVKNVSTIPLKMTRMDKATVVLGYHNEVTVHRAELIDLLQRNVFDGHYVQMTNFIMTREPANGTNRMGS